LPSSCPDGSYYLGNFDGKKFSPETTKLKGDWGKNYYSPQTWSNLPNQEGRVIQIAWMKNGNYPEMPFNGQMTFPCDLLVKKFPEGYQIVKKPINEIEKVHFRRYSWENKNVIPGIKDNKLKRVASDCLHLIADIDLETSENIGFVFCNNLKSAGTDITYDVKRQILSVLGCNIPLKPISNKIKFEILVDQSSIEIFLNDGRTVISNCFTPLDGASGSILYTNGGELGIDHMVVFDMESMWNE
jgi:sucrose-6-phosphate hydrolase SacC (GH32 family)